MDLEQKWCSNSSKIKQQRKEATFYRKQTAMTFPGVARIQENLRSVCPFRSAGRRATVWAYFVRTIGNSPLKDGTKKALDKAIQRRWDGVGEGGKHMHTYGWFMLLYGRNQHSSVSNYLLIKNT